MRWRWRITLSLVLAAAGACVGVWLLPPPARSVLPGVAADHAHGRLCFSADGRLLAADSYGPDRECTLRVWNLVEDTSQVIFQGSAQIESIVFSPEGKRIAVRRFDRAIHVWNRETGNRIGAYARTEWREWNPHLPIVYSADGRLLAYGPDPSSGQLWDVETGQEIRSLFEPGEAWSTITARSDGFITSYHGGTVKTWGLPGGVTGVFEPCDENDLGDFAISGDGQVLASCASPLLRVRWSRKTQERVLDTGENITRPALSFDGALVAVTCMRPRSRAEPFLRYFVTPGSRQLVRVHDVPTGRTIATVGEARLATFSPDSRLLAVVGADASIRLYDVPFATPWSHVMVLSVLIFVAANGSICAWHAWRRKRGRVGETPS